MKYLNCPWCGSSHGYLNNNCPSCGGTLTHKSDLLNLILNKCHLSKTNSKSVPRTENKNEHIKPNLSAISIKSLIVIMLVIFGLVTIVANTSIKTSEHQNLDNQNPQNKLSAKQQLHQLMRDEKIKLGSKVDIENWVAVARKNNESYKHRMYLGGNTYVVEQQITFPDDMYGSHSRTFILKDNVKLPYGDIAHNTVYFMSDGKCMGTACIK